MLKIIIIFVLFYYRTIAQSSIEYFNALNGIDKDSIKKHLDYLASDELEGRGLGSKGIEQAANYISKYFSSLNLKKVPGKNNYFQEIPMLGRNLLQNSELVILNNDTTITLKYSEDYFLYKLGQQTFIPQPLEIIFVGYGIVASEYDYNDYQSVDVEGKIVVYLDSEPYSEDPDFFNGLLPTRYSTAEMKRRIAISRGAAGTILIPIERYTDWSDVKRDFDIEDVILAYDVSSNLSLIINPNAANILFNNSGYSFEDVLEMHKNHKIKSFDLQSKLKFKGYFKERSFLEKNVIGTISGDDNKLKDSYIIVSAHYDHLGIGKAIHNDSIYNGAMDNAIGVSVMLEIARALSSLSLKRSVVFIATTGEERGLLGSIYYTDNPVYPLYKTIANLNIDGIAFFRDFKSLIEIGGEYSNLGEYSQRIAEKFGLTIDEIPDEFYSFGAFNNSDHYAFAMAGIPSIIILEGLENKNLSRDEVKNEFIDYYLNRYHTPFDDLRQNIDYVAAERHAKVLFDLVYQLAISNEPPTWYSDSPFLKYYQRNLAEKR